MKHSTLLTGALCALLMPSLACNLLDVNDSENVPGRGARAFDPYRSAASGAIRLSLQQYNGCAVVPSGQVVPKNSVPIPYPDTCPSPVAIDGFPPYNGPGRLQLVTETDYFLNQFTVVDTVLNQHTNSTDLSNVVNWFKTQSRFKNLDWGNVGQQSSDWLFAAEVPGVLQASWTRVVLFDNANWRRVKGDTFRVEVLDSEGVVRGTPVEYDRSEFVTDAPWGFRSQFSWRMEGVRPPRFPGDTQVNPLPEIAGWPPQSPVFRTSARLDLFGSTNPFKTFRIPLLRGEGALRVTWSQMPKEPFYFPVSFVSQQDLPPSCTDAAGAPTPCAFGLDPNLTFVKPANGEFYKPGEMVNVFVDVRDGEGNRLHSPDLLPSGAEAISDQANGMLYASIPWINGMLETDMIPTVTFAGPIHKLTPRSDVTGPAPYFGEEYAYSPISETATTPLGTAEMGQKWSTRYGRQLPENAEPGTYVALIKWHRYFGGERVAKTKEYFFQVGQKERTSYPGNVGNCQICHRGVLSLDNLRHGQSVDHVETCKVCHHTESTTNGGVLGTTVHRIHMRSSRYPAAKNDCTMCHLTGEIPKRPSIEACSGCHPSMHGDEYFSATFNQSKEPNRFGNCAQSCHGDTPPQTHILPGN
jgi:hypothetical protein